MFAQESVMDIEKIKKLALANGFKLKEQASGNMDLNAYVYEFANAIEQAAKAQAIPEGFVLVPKTNSDKGIESMAMRYRHDFPLLDADYQEAIKAQMRQLYEEAVGLGFYIHKAQESGND